MKRTSISVGDIRECEYGVFKSGAMSLRTHLIGTICVVVSILIELIQNQQIQNQQYGLTLYFPMLNNESQCIKLSLQIRKMRKNETRCRAKVFNDSCHTVSRIFIIH